MNGAIPLVLLHGWGAHGGVWAELSALLGERFAVQAPDIDGGGSFDEAVDRLAAAAPARCVVGGWSLGGQLALSWAWRHPAQVGRLALFATTPKFVAGDGWPQGMAQTEFESFTAAVESDAAAALRRFRLLQTRGDAQARTVARQLERLLETRSIAAAGRLLRMLGWLRDVDLRAQLPDIRQPVLLIHGDCDSLIPPAAAGALVAALPDARAARFVGAAHVPFVSDAVQACALITEFCNES
ncbi:MAG: alpha/beta fold hydrolase [Burkholderiales bacterium]|nr:alpha/beta fold hydrolase [Burkholderiales bacterium]